MQLEDFVGSSDGICDNGDIMDVIFFHCRDETDAYGYELGFNRSDIHCLDLELLDNLIIFPNVDSSCCYIGFLDASIGNNKGIVREIL